MTAEPASLQLVVFTLAREQYALPIASVSEIIRYTPPRAIPSPRQWIRGIISRRGKIVPILDLGARLGLPPADADPGDKIIILATGAEPVGFTVAAVDRVLTVSTADIEPIPLGSTDPGIIGILTRGDQIVLVLEPAALFGDVGSPPSAAPDDEPPPRLVPASDAKRRPPV